MVVKKSGSSGSGNSISILPVLIAWFVAAAIVSLFNWHPLIFVLCVLCIYGLSGLFFAEIFLKKFDSTFSFVVLLLSELVLFLTISLGVLWFDCYGYPGLSNKSEWSMLGTALLVTSSFSVSLFLSFAGLDYAYSNLKLTLTLGSVFCFCQYCEFREDLAVLIYSGYEAAALILVSLHFAHVAVGVTILCTLFKFGSVLVSKRHSEMVVWYWHLIDLVWLVVYLVVYVMKFSSS